MYIYIYIYTYRQTERENASRHIFTNNVKSVSFQITV